MLHLHSFKLLTSESISPSLDRKHRLKTERRLKDLLNILGIQGKNGSSSISSSVHHLSPKKFVQHHQIIAIHWDEEYQALILLLSNGLLVWCFFDRLSLDCISSINFDRYLEGKIKSDNIVDTLFDKNRLFISYISAKLICILIDDKKHRNFGTTKSKQFKLKFKDVTILEHDLSIKYAPRQVQRHLILNRNKTSDEELLLVWWQNSLNTPCPWSSSIDGSKEFCNIIIYDVSRDALELCGYGWIMNEILEINFCRQRQNVLIIIESDQQSENTYYREYQIISTDRNSPYSIEMIASVRLATPAKCLKADINLQLNKVLLLCENRTVIMYNIDRDTINYFQTPINAVDLVICPLDSYFIVSDSCGQIMMYDFSLHVIPANYDDLFIQEAYSGLRKMEFMGSTSLSLKFMDNHDLIFISLPPDLDYVSLIRVYTVHDYVNEALENLQQLNWNINSYDAHTSLNIIFNHLIRQPLNPISESQLEATLATFYIPKIAIQEDIVNEYQYEMFCVAKRFFMLLINFSCIEKAFSLAIDLKSSHLFLLLHKIAKERGNEKLAQISMNYARQFRDANSAGMNKHHLESAGNEEQPSFRSSSSNSKDGKPHHTIISSNPHGTIINVQSQNSSNSICSKPPIHPNPTSIPRIPFQTHTTHSSLPPSFDKRLVGQPIINIPPVPTKPSILRPSSIESSQLNNNVPPHIVNDCGTSSPSPDVKSFQDREFIPKNQRFIVYL
ncbi:WD repeat-containing and planar cell polarity effector protein fritz [Brevipalpus obovatus]|uniref:WD repeat-containing and planar cell polarity effector protein fritz n=1 Tax=Brevipalpus obovatus TaxID=246614 RepID=UPI003D9DC22C